MAGRGIIPVIKGRGWGAEKANAFKGAFYEFASHCRVNSKELGNIALGEHFYRAQHRFFDAVFDGLAQDLHDFKHLKSRQLGISTASRALTIFWAGVHAGLKGYMIFDSAAHQNEARLELINMIKSLPPKLRFPTIVRENRDLIELSNGTTVNFASAGLKAGKTSGVLGRSSGVNFAHCSEICSWDNAEGVEAFKNSLAEDFPDRLYIWESTARGPNMWKEMWEEAKADPEHQVCIFSGWWSKDNQFIQKGTADFARYGDHPPSDNELIKIRDVKELYGWQVTAEQLAWVRRKMDPAAKPEGDAPPEFEGDALRVQEQPWVESESFQITGSIFFQPEVLTDQSNKYVSQKFKSYSYTHGTEIIYCRAYPARNARSVELKVWEEPEPYDAIYVIAADPAYGHNENNDRSAIQVLRAYADGLDQVAEYAWPLVNARQFAWVIASLSAWYAGDRNDVYNIIELNGPGDAVWAEWNSLKHNLQSGYLMKEGEETGLRRILPNIRNYIYQRNDSMSPGHNWQWQMSPRLKVSIMERLRDFVSHDMLHIRSADTLEEMKWVTREGDSIEAQGRKKDDRVVTLAMGIRCWEQRVRKVMSVQQRTRANELAKRRLTIRDQYALYSKYQLDQVFARKRRYRAAEARLMTRSTWRG